MQVAKSILIGMTSIMLVLASEICGQTCLSVFLPTQTNADLSGFAHQSSQYESHSSQDSMSSDPNSDATNSSDHCDSSEKQATTSSDHCDGSDCEMGCEMWVKSEESIALFTGADTQERDLSKSGILFIFVNTPDPKWIIPPPLRPHSSPLYLRNETLLI